MARTPRLDASDLSVAGQPLAAGPKVWTRRRLLGVGASLPLLTLTGCSVSNPAIVTSSTAARTSGPDGSGGPNPSSGVSPSPPGFPKLAVREQALADLAAAIGRRGGLNGGQRQLLSFVRDVHTDHARVLASTDPSARASTDDPVQAPKTSLTGVSTAAALKRLASAEGTLAGAHRSAALGATGLTALLWGSLAVADESFAAAVTAKSPPTTGALRVHRPATVLSDAAAVQQLVGQLHAIIWGYQLAIGKMSVAGKSRGRAIDGLLQHRILRDRLIAWLVARKADVPAAEAAYVPSPTPTDTGSAGRLVRSMETALLPFVGIWLAAAATTADRELALTALRSTSRTARGWGAGVRGWPGWSD